MATSTESVSTCIRCGQSFPSAELVITGDGYACVHCEAGADAGDDALTAAGLDKARKAVYGAAASCLFASVVSARSSSVVDSSVNGHGTATTTVSADIPGLLGAGVALLFVLVGLYLAVSARSVGPGGTDQPAPLGRRLLYTAALLALAAWAGLELLDALPSTTVSEY